jgi:competence ComEA-like helix-hairpin-helix protein
VLERVSAAEERAREAERKAREAEAAATSSIRAARELGANPPPPQNPPVPPPEKPAPPPPPAPTASSPGPQPTPEPAAPPPPSSEQPAPPSDPDRDEEGGGILGRTVGAILGNVPGREGAEQETGQVNLNDASFEELRELGFSVTQATRVITYRERQQGFNSVDDLADVPGMPSEFVDQVRGKLTL